MSGVGCREDGAEWEGRERERRVGRRVPVEEEQGGGRRERERGGGRGRTAQAGTGDDACHGGEWLRGEGNARQGQAGAREAVDADAIVLIE